MGRPNLVFTRNAARLAVPSADHLQIVDVASQAPTVEIPLEGLRDLAIVDQEIWAVTRDARLHRLTSAGEEIGAPTSLPGIIDGASLQPVRGAVHAAAWLGHPPSMIAIEGGEITITSLPIEADLVLPVSTSRWVVCKRDRVMVREARSQRWATSIAEHEGRVVDGAILFDRRSIGLLVDDPGANGDLRRQLIVLGLHEPIIHHRMTLTGVDQVRFAAARGFALLHTARRLLLVDLRFGRVLKEVDIEADVTDLAIDEAAQQIALRTDHEIVHLNVQVLLATPQRRVAYDPEVEAPAVPEVVEPTASPPIAEAPPESAADFHHGHAPLASVAALAPRMPVTRTTTGESIGLLERYGELVAALAGRAIAVAWDEGRLTFPNQGGLPFKLEVLGLLGRSKGLARGDVQEADASVAQRLAAVQAAESAIVDRMPPLEAITREYQLSSLARLILLIVAAPALWGEMARLYGILANDDHRPLCDELLVHHMLGTHSNRHEVARELSRDGGLLRYGLIRQAEGRNRPFAGLQVDPIIVRLLRGAADDERDDELRVVTTDRTLEELFIPSAIKDAVVRVVAVAGPEPTRIVVRGRIGSGRRTLLAVLAAAAGRRLGIIDATPMIRDIRSRPEPLRMAMRRAHLLGLLPCIVGLEAIGSEDQSSRDAIREILRLEPGPVSMILPWDGQSPLPPGHITIDLPLLTIEQRVVCWKAKLAAAGLDLADSSEIAMRYTVGPGVVARVCEQVAAAFAESGETHPDVAAALDAAIRSHLESRLGTTATRVTRLASWSRVVLPPEVQDSLLELIARIKHRRTVFETWGFDVVMSTSRGVTALFSGGPGTGKTLVASAIANELGMDLYRVDLSRIMSKWIGETEQNLAKLFDAAEDGHAIILFDEADSLFGKRTEVRTSVDRYANLEVNYLLQRLDTFEGIALLTTNFGTAIDPAFKRRLSFRLTFPFPDEEMREMLWRAHVPPNVPTTGELDFGALARRYRLSGGYIRNATLRAAFLAAEEQTPLSQDHLERAIRAEFREIGKLADSGVLE